MLDGGSGGGEYFLLKILVVGGVFFGALTLSVIDYKRRMTDKPWDNKETKEKEVNNIKK
ncbi:MAG: hypothetical protein PHQ18_01100 [Patescibacteria group bacterium]|nr:hypothetical protein [Patescibacteria group bacterium]